MEKHQGMTGKLVKQLIHIGAVILDEPGYLTFPESGGALLFHLISHQCPKASFITINLNCAGWYRLLAIPG
jgi:DNA replication protein DnaC